MKIMLTVIQLVLFPSLGVPGVLVKGTNNQTGLYVSKDYETKVQRGKTAIFQIQGHLWMLLRNQNLGAI